MKKMNKNITKVLLVAIALISLVSAPTVSAATYKDLKWGNQMYKVVIAGGVTAVNGKTISVLATNGSNYTVDITNAKITVKKQSFIYGSLMVNDQVTINGQLGNNNNITAKYLDITVKVPTYLTVDGQIVGLTNDSMTVLANDGTNYNVLKSNASLTINGQAADLSKLNGGDKLTVNGVLVGVNKISAQSINISISSASTQIYGRVISTDLDGKNISLRWDNGAVYTVYVGNAQILLSGKLAGLSDLKSGNQINITGQWLNGSTFLAKTVTGTLNTSCSNSYNQGYRNHRTNSTSTNCGCTR